MRVKDRLVTDQDFYVRTQKLKVIVLLVLGTLALLVSYFH